MRVRAMTEHRTRGFDVSGTVLPLSGKSNCVQPHVQRPRVCGLCYTMWHPWSRRPRGSSWPGVTGMRVRAMTERRTRALAVAGTVLPFSGKSSCV